MTGTAEAIGRLLADSALLKGERDLLRRPTGSTPETPKDVQHAPSTPITNDAKSVAAVLLTLLDDRLQATEGNTLSTQNATAKPGRAADHATSQPARVAAKYAEETILAATEASRRDGLATGGPPPLNITGAGSPAEVQTFLQRFAAFAASTGGDLPAGSTKDAADRKELVARVLWGSATVVALLMSLCLLVWELVR